ncbi:sigma-54-dependent Fis family transcriptional regulator [Geobacter sp. AOG2]|uniref:sigma-54-dependent Fis family transcriptional regulator n=1 Tax=Geobacter sp. AOG2 TaxID=1566347 RepID=UPI001CC74102|nr:sigma-54-dependent Fis family transcriptional regulator [Geobacter sp. AOG2]GFE62062.1 sigma-54-dependent Fis family transcriptional regulator [Geobacter sp. AOG2]
MKVDDLDLRELLSFNPKGGSIQFMDERALLFDAAALGLLRKELIDNLGMFAARSILTRFGYAHGWRTAENMRSKMPEIWKEAKGKAGPKFHSLTGLVKVRNSKRTKGEGDEPLIDSIWDESFEAEQHLLHIGLEKEPVCWTLVGYASGFVSCIEGREVYFIEDKCRGKGDATCHVVAHFKEKWGTEIGPHLTYYQMESSSAILKELSDKLHCIENRLKKRKEQLAFLEDNEDADQPITARSAAMRSIVDIARRIAAVDSTVLISGDSGVGKERIARFIHDQSARECLPFVAVNCGALTETLLESELFGHAKGAFTGADKDRQGLFEAATGGTLFLDEIGEVSPGMQVKLLRVLQEREIRRVGENKSRPIDVRVVAATNRNLANEINAGRFRQDLYYRLRVIELRVPPLRERHEDILPLARFFLTKIAKNLRRSITGFTPSAADRLLRYDWPGNVRELQNSVEYAVALCQGSQIDVDDFPCELRVVPLTPVVSGCMRSLSEIEQDYILGVLHAMDGKIYPAAAVLKISVATLYRKLREYGVQ